MADKLSHHETTSYVYSDADMIVTFTQSLEYQADTSDEIIVEAIVASGSGSVEVTKPAKKKVKVAKAGTSVDILTQVQKSSADVKAAVSYTLGNAIPVTVYDV